MHHVHHNYQAMYPNQVNTKPSPNLKLGLSALRKKKITYFTCPNCPLHLNIKYHPTKEHIEALDGTKVKQLQCYRCNKIVWKCDSCNGNHTCDTINSVKLHNRRHHNKKSNDQNTTECTYVIIDNMTMEDIVTDGFFRELGNEADWMAFANNLRTVDQEHRRLITVIHEGNTDKYLVANSQDKGHVDEDKMNKHDNNEVALHLDITTLASNLKPQENELLMKIIKNTKKATENRMLNTNKDVVFTTMPDNASDLKRHCLKSSHSILKNMPTPKYLNYGHIANVSAKKPIRFALLIGSNKALLRPDHIDEDVSKMVNNMIGHGKGLQKDLRKLASVIKNSV